MHTNFHSNRLKYICENYIFLDALENLFRASALSPCIRCQMSYARAIEHLYFNIFFHLSMKKESESACEILFRLVFIVFCIFFMLSSATCSALGCSSTCERSTTYKSTVTHIIMVLYTKLRYKLALCLIVTHTKFQHDISIHIEIKAN